MVQLGVSPGNLWKFTCLAGGYFTNNHRESMIFNMSLNHPKWGYNGYTMRVCIMGIQRGQKIVFRYVYFLGM